VSAAPNKTLFPSLLKRRVSFPIVVVFPTPFTPTILMTNGFGASPSLAVKVRFKIRSHSARTKILKSLSVLWFFWFSLTAYNYFIRSDN
jgi:hypothetical protein